MLKKLVKFGNSNALILDRAILELLNIQEGSLVKLHINGNCLTITPQQSAPQETPSMSGSEKLQDYIEEKKKAAIDLVNETNFTSHPNYALLQEQMKKIAVKHSKAINGYDHQAFVAEVDALAEKKYQGNKHTPEFIAEVQLIQARYSPGLAAMQKEMAEVSKKLGF